MDTTKYRALLTTGGKDSSSEGCIPGIIYKDGL